MFNLLILLSTVLFASKLVHALNINKIGAPTSTTTAYVRFLINAHEIGKASITSVYSR